MREKHNHFNHSGENCIIFILFVNICIIRSMILLNLHWFIVNLIKFYKKYQNSIAKNYSNHIYQVKIDLTELISLK